MKNKKIVLALALFSLGAAITFTACGDDSSSSSEEVVSCYIYNTVDAKSKETRESCIEAEKGSTAADSIKILCESLDKDFADSKEDWAKLGNGCSSDKKSVATCTVENDRIGTFTSLYYSLDNEQKKLVVKGDKKKTCDNLIEEEFDFDYDDDDE